MQTLAPIAANASVAGRVTDEFGGGIRNAKITLTNSQGASRSVVTGSFGFYRFDEVPVGEIYAVGVSAKQYSFAVSSQAINPTEAIDNLNFTATSKRR